MSREMNQVRRSGLAYCEPSTAFALGRVHVRVLGPVPLSPSGLPAGTVALCGRDVASGWDLPGDVSTDSLAADAQLRPDGVVLLCPACGKAAAAILVESAVD